MGRPKKLRPSIEKTICLDGDLVSRVDLILYSELEGKVPFGAWQRFVTLAITNQLARGTNFTKEPWNQSLLITEVKGCNPLSKS